MPGLAKLNFEITGLTVWNLSCQNIAIPIMGKCNAHNLTILLS